MTLLSPMAGLILALAVIPPLIILYFLKLRRRPQAVSTTLLWKKSIEDLRANAPFQKLRKSLLLLLQLIVLALLALSLMQPQIQAGQQEGGKTVIIIDNSGSMSSTDAASGSATRLDEAKKRAKEKIETLYSGGLFASSADETMIIVFSDRAEIYSRFTDSKQQLLAAIDRIQPTHGESRIADALKLARAYTTNVNPDQIDRPIADPATIELYSDGRIQDLNEQVIRGEGMHYHAIGSPEADNVAIANVSVERPYDRQTSVEVFVALLNFNAQAASCDIQLSVNDRARGIEATTIPAAQKNPSTGELMPGRANVVFTPFEQPAGAVIEIANLREDKLATDNVAHVAVSPPKRLTVAIVSADHRRSIILPALEGMKLERLVEMLPDEFDSLAEKGELDPYDVIVIESYRPKLMPAGRYLTFGPTPPIEGLSEFGEGKQQVILAAKDEHPVMRHVTHDRIFISKFKQIQPGSDVQVLMEGSTGPAALAVSRGPMQLVHCTFDPLDSNWPFERSFVNFIVNSLEFLGNSGQSITNQSLKPGDAITTRLPEKARDIQLLTPESTAPVSLNPVDPTQLAWGPIRLAGLYILSWKSGEGDEAQSRPFAVNLLSEHEGRLEVNPVIEMGEDKIAGRRADESVYTPLWPYALGLCLAVLMLEWWIYHKKAYI